MYGRQAAFAGDGDAKRPQSVEGLRLLGAQRRSADGGAWPAATTS
jgi:hypothetical protein